MIGFLLQGSVIGLGLLAAWAWPRVAGQGLLTRASAINLMTGALLYPVRLGLGWLGADTLGARLGGWISLNGWPAWAALLVAFLAVDLARYALHYAHHRVPILWSFHRVHHSVEQMDVTAGLRMHVVDFLQLSLLPGVVLGGLLDLTAQPGWVIPSVLAVGTVADACAHANVRFPLDTAWRRVWFYAFQNPLFHSWHHTRDGHLIDGNYASALPLWDHLFRTAVGGEEPPALYGIDGPQRLREGVIAMQLLQRRA